MEQITINMAEYANLSDEKLADKYFSQPAPVRRVVYDHLSQEQQKYIRPLAEARRGIVRDESGNIIRSKEWKKSRKSELEAKIAGLEQRIENAKVEMKEIDSELKKAK